MRVLVVGGAGYIGSHCVRRLLEQGEEPMVLDNLSNGHRGSLDPAVPFFEGDLGEQETVRRIFEEHRPDVVMHFAAFAYVGESVEKPMKYYRNNVVNTLLLIEEMLRAKIHRFVFSSSCATFGVPESLPIREDLPQRPINPYGQTKLDIENALKAIAASSPFSFSSLRYFNASGADPRGDIGEDHDPETHLIPLVIAAAMGRNDSLKIFGTDYPTEDGTAVRDYIHVNDLADAHVLAMRRLTDGAGFFYNLGTEEGHSVRAVIESVERISGKKVPYEEGPRRPGDPPKLYADSSRIRGELGWTPNYRDLDGIVETAWRWHESHPEGYVDDDVCG
jgi:UDP-glucose 4-epimerase